MHTRDQFAEALGVEPCDTGAWDAVARHYPARATRHYLCLANPSDPGDPILRQCIPDARELTDEAASADPLAEKRDSPVPGLVHRYPDRALLVLTRRCAVHCRHCLRKRIWRDGRGEECLTPDYLPAALEYLGRQQGIREVLLSGGDPLMLGNARLEEVLRALRTVPHLEIVRVGTRMPVVLPSRVSDSFCDMLRRFRPVWVATQFNHPVELTPEAEGACARLLERGIPIVNQSVLLRGVNDDVDTLESLFRGLLRFGVKPYYLFHGDPVRGTSHFRTGVAAGLRLMDALSKRLSGLATPTFAVDLPGGEGKIALTPDSPLRTRGDGTVELTRADGTTVSYPDEGTDRA